MGRLVDVLTQPINADSRDRNVQAAAGQLLGALVGSCPEGELAPHAGRLAGAAARLVGGQLGAAGGGGGAGGAAELESLLQQIRRLEV